MPDWRKEIRSVIAALNLDPMRESEIVEELAQHLGDRREDLLASGLNARQADEALIRELHDRALIAGLKATIAREKLPLPVGGMDASGRFRVYGFRVCGWICAMARVCCFRIPALQSW